MSVSVNIKFEVVILEMKIYSNLKIFGGIFGLILK